MAFVTHKPRLCYIMPSYRKDAATHFAYLLNFVERAAISFEIALVIEEGSLPVLTEVKRAELLRSFFPLARFLELCVRLFVMRMRGYRDFYVHYSFRGALIASLCTKVMGGRVFYWNCGEPWKYKRSWFRDALERAVYHSISYLVTGTPGLARRYGEQYGIPAEKIKIMPNWIVLDRFAADRGARAAMRKKFHLSSEWRVALFVHRLSRRKGAHLLLALGDALAKHRVKLFVVGEGPLEAELKKEAEKRGLAEHIFFIGGVPHSELPSFFAAADIFVMPSEEEGFPHVLLEAMAWGIPFVATDVGGVREMIPPELGVWLVPPGDALVFAARTIALLSLSAREEQTMAKRERAWVAQFEESRVLQIFSALFRNPIPPA
jgi:glycosyltransferase involved in cell wall biosynthesis